MLIIAVEQKQDFNASKCARYMFMMRLGAKLLEDDLLCSSTHLIQ